MMSSGTEEGYKVLAKAEVPEQMERQAMMRQLHQFAASEFGDAGFSNYGYPMDVYVIDEYNEAYEDDAISVGFSVTIKSSSPSCA